MAGEIFSGHHHLPDVIEYRIHQHLRIHEVFATVLRLSKAARQRVRRSFPKYPWDVEHKDPYDVHKGREAHVWLQHLCKARVNIRKLTFVRDFVCVRVRYCS